MPTDLWILFSSIPSAVQLLGWVHFYSITGSLITIGINLFYIIHGTVEDILITGCVEKFLYKL